MPRAQTNIQTKLCDAALRLAAKHGWNALTLDRIATAAKVPGAQARKIFPDKNKILPAIIRRIDEQTISPAGNGGARASSRDSLFEAIMARFDVLQEHRASILAIMDAVRNDPSLAHLILPAQWHSMQKMLAYAGIASENGGRNLRQMATIFGLLGVYYRALYRWRKDDTADMAKTMAAVDQGLRYGCTIADILFRDS